jgi:hypothetical protein
VFSSEKCKKRGLTPGGPHNAAVHALYPIALHVFRQSLADRPAASVQAAEVARLCEERASAFPQHAAFWAGAASVFAKMLASDATAQGLARRGTAYSHRGEEQLAALC